MIVLLDVGNSQILGGIIQDASPAIPQITLRFRKSTHSGASSDELGLCTA